MFATLQPRPVGVCAKGGIARRHGLGPDDKERTLTLGDKELLSLYDEQEHFRSVIDDLKHRTGEVSSGLSFNKLL